MLPKIDVTIDGILTEVFTMQELTGTKIGAINAEVDKIVELDVELTIHADEDVDLVTEEYVCSSVDEVLDTSIDDT